MLLAGPTVNLLGRARDGETSPAIPGPGSIPKGWKVATDKGWGLPGAPLPAG